MSNPIGKEDQLVLIAEQKSKFTSNYWKGCLEVDGSKEYSYADILVLANDETETILRVLKVDKYGNVEDITDAVLEFSENQP